MFYAKGDASTIRRLADNNSDEEENISYKWEEPSLATKVTPTSQTDSTTRQISNVTTKTGSKRPLSNHVCHQIMFH